MGGKQGDQMILCEYRTKCSPTDILTTLIHNFFRGIDVGRKLWATSEIFKRLPKENFLPKGENSPNLVTLVAKTCL
jgi:hypothetical protein